MIIREGAGIYGSLLHYASFLALSGSALLVLLYFWSKGNLNMDEEAKINMMQEEQEGENERK